MKRYWKLAVLVPFIVLSIGIYYAEASAGNNPEYVLKFQQGDEKEAEPITLEAMYRNNPVSIDSEGSKYRNKPFFWESWGPSYIDNMKLEKLVKEHPQFMRGKINANAFYEDDQIIGYGDIKSKFTSEEGQSDIRFAVSIYDKLRKNSSSFEVKVPEESLYNLISLNEIRIEGQAMKLMTLNFKRNESNPTQYTNPSIHLYTLDLDKKNVTEDRIIFSAESSDDSIQAHVMRVNREDSTKPSGYNAFLIDYNKKATATKSSGDYVWDHRELFIYDTENGKAETIRSKTINELLANGNNQDITQSGDDLFLTFLTNPKGPRVIRYNLAEKKVTNDLTIALKDFTPESGKMNFSEISNNRLYLLYTRYGRSAVPTVAIAELDSGKIVYTGTVSRKDNKELDNLMIMGNFTLK